MTEVWFDAIPAFKRCVFGGSGDTTIVQVGSMEQCSGPILGGGGTAVEECSHSGAEGVVPFFHFRILVGTVGASWFNDVYFEIIKLHCFLKLVGVSEFSTLVGARHFRNERGRCA